MRSVLCFCSAGLHGFCHGVSLCGVGRCFIDNFSNTIIRSNEAWCPEDVTGNSYLSFVFHSSVEVWLQRVRLRNRLELQNILKQSYLGPDRGSGTHINFVFMMKPPPTLILLNLHISVDADRLLQKSVTNTALFNKLLLNEIFFVSLSRGFTALVYDAAKMSGRLIQDE